MSLFSPYPKRVPVSPVVTLPCGDAMILDILTACTEQLDVDGPFWSPMAEAFHRVSENLIRYSTGDKSPSPSIASVLKAGPRRET